MVIETERQISAYEVGHRTVWEMLEERNAPVESLLTEDINPSDVVDFVKGSSRIFSRVADINPSVLFTAARGGCVITWAVEEIAAEQGYMLPETHILLVGNRVAVNDTRLRSPSKRERSKTVKAHYGLSEEHLGRVENPVFIDEKVNGGSSRYTAVKIDGLIKERAEEYMGQLHLLAMEYAEPKIDRYEGILQCSQGSISPEIIKAKNPFVDRKAFLDTIIEPPALPESMQAMKSTMLMRVHNEESEELIKMLTLSVMNPDVLEEVLNFISGNQFSDIEQFSDFDRLFTYINTILSDHSGEDFKLGFVEWLADLVRASR